MFKIKYLLHRTKSFIHYLIFAKHGNGQGIHSPFLWEFWKNVISVNQPYSAYSKVNSLRKLQLANTSEIKPLEIGAGSSVNFRKIITVADIAKTSGIKKKYGELLFRTVNYFQPNTIIELGTSLGISSLYIALANSQAKVITIEACCERAKIAAAAHKKAKVKNIEIINNSFEKALPELIKRHEQFDFVFFDGNHKKQATLEYYEVCKSKANNNSVFVFDDIYWSKGMQEAWNEIKSDAAVSFSLDFYQFGMIFFRKELPKSNFTIRY